jgi:hypothetical protein
MTDKVIKNEQWFVKNLTQKIKNGEIYKPKVQRKKKWDILPKKDKTPSEKNYIIFLYSKHNSVHAITFGQINGKFSNIDGNNRINAISHFLSEPFALFPEYLSKINIFIDYCFENFEVNNQFKTIIQKMSYNEIITFKYNKYFEEIGEKKLYDEHLKFKRDEFEVYFDEIISMLKINNEDRFDHSVKINVNLFEGYSTEELNSLFGEINQYDNKLSEIELLACRLSEVNNFEINNPIIKAEIIICIKEFYMNKNKDEILNCYTFDENIDKMNAYDFMVGFQNYANKQCKIICETGNDGLSIFFKLYKTLYQGSLDNTFTNENINNFITKIEKSIAILKIVCNDIFMEKLANKNKTFDACNKKIDSLRKNNMYLIIAAIIGYYEKDENTEVIIKSIEKAILFHFFVQEIHDTKRREIFQLADSIHYTAGGNFINNQANKFYENPNKISDEITENKMIEVIQQLIEENIKNKKYIVRSNGKDKIDKRRSRKFHEKALIYIYYKNRVPTEFLKNNFWTEHICPFSCSWDNEIDIDRFGNIIPIIDELNNSRLNKHISEYRKKDKDNFINYVNDIIPSNELYDKIISHIDKKPHVIDTIKYDYLCKRNEEVFKNTFIKYLFHT